MKHVITHDFRGVTLERYERLYFDDAFNTAIMPVAGLKKREVLASREEGGKQYQKILVHPERDLPAAIKKLIPGDIAYHEESWFDRGRHAVDVVAKIGALGDKLDIRSQLSFEALPNGVRRTLTANITVSVFGVGRLIEKAIADNLTDTYEKLAAFTQRWIDDGKA